MIKAKSKKFKGTFLLILVMATVSLFFSIEPVRMYAENDVVEQKIICTATVEDDFAGDSILITLTEKESRKFKRYTEKDFPEIECESVEDLTEYTVDYVEECYDKQTFTKQFA